MLPYGWWEALVYRAEADQSSSHALVGRLAFRVECARACVCEDKNDKTWVAKLKRTAERRQVRVRFVLFLLIPDFRQDCNHFEAVAFRFC